ncbi:zinc ribbon domain-containing protein [Halomonas sp. HP20-15]|uniref:FmdB family zinc ribbon protein n=1 Tax=Halomonas sp. HP20-15 TaxID=3085901 RepID=UPI002981A81E|nr:zinc ribbon domain-containing protein [Halomonas sp. HP20-15]MDW5375555.1 zinc ribbon domain-containing protein [Halomonas sp. HP20-15]
MPIYEYECKACGHRLEKLQKVSAAPLSECPACQTESLSRLISAAGFRLAGGGWYETDFKSGGTKRNLAGDGNSKAPASGDKPAPSSTPASDAKASA